MLQILGKRQASGPESAPFACLRCGACCRWPGHVLLTDPDIARLAGFVGLDEAALINRYTRLASNRAQLSLVEQGDGACIFLDGARCRVYPARPAQCRSFPHAWAVAGCPCLARTSTVDEERS